MKMNKKNNLSKTEWNPMINKLILKDIILKTIFSKEIKVLVEIFL